MLWSTSLIQIQTKGTNDRCMWQPAADPTSKTLPQSTDVFLFLCCQVLELTINQIDRFLGSRLEHGRGWTGSIKKCVTVCCRMCGRRLVLPSIYVQTAKSSMGDNMRVGFLFFFELYLCRIRSLRIKKSLWIPSLVLKVAHPESILNW